MTDVQLSRPGIATPALTNLWLVVGAAGLTAIGAYVLVASVNLRAAVIVALSAIAGAAILLGVRTYRPAGTAAWYALAATQGLWTIGWALWQWRLVRDGAPPGPTGAANFFFLAGYPFVAAALVFLARRRESDLVSVIDSALVVVGLATVAWAALLASYVHEASVTPVGRGVQLAYGFADVIVAGVTLRAALAPGRRPPAFVLLLLASLGTVASDFIWNWYTRLDDYSPGSWADTGWLLFPALIAIAALHPSMRTVFAPAPRTERSVGWDRLALLLGMMLVAPVVVAVEAGRHGAHATLVLVGTAVGAAVLSTLVLARLTVILREGERLARGVAEQNERLLTLDRLKDDFVSAVSHELRTPLTSIRGYLELALDPDEGDLNEQQRRFLQVADRNSERLLRLVGDLLFVAQVEAGQLGLELGSVDPNALVDEAVQSARPLAADKNIELSLDARPAPALRGDRSRLAQLLDNLVSNALKFTPAGGRVDVVLRSDNGRVTFEVRDTGLGISEEDQARLFERFFRSSAATAHAIQGTGLGLAIVKAIVDGHGGTISVSSSVGAGTAFRVDLPTGESTT